MLEQLQMLFISECDMVEGSCDTDAIRQITKATQLFSISETRTHVGICTIAFFQIKLYVNAVRFMKALLGKN